jgi:hypothetical protein
VTPGSAVHTDGWKSYAGLSNPCRGVDRFKIEAKDRVLSDDEWRAFAEKLDAATEEWPHNVAMVRFLVHTGMRRGDQPSVRQSQP